MRGSVVAAGVFTFMVSRRALGGVPLDLVMDQVCEAMPGVDVSGFVREPLPDHLPIETTWTGSAKVSAARGETARRRTVERAIERAARVAVGETAA